MQGFLSQANACALKFAPRERGLLDGPMNSDNVKVYTSLTESYSAVIVIVTLDLLKIVMIYGHFDPARVGGTVNLPQPGGTMNASMMQMTAFKGDEEGAAFLAIPEGSPPPCAEFNYSVVTMDLGADGTFGIKPSDWKVGDADAYTFKTSELTPFTMEELTTNVGGWCRAPLVSSRPPAKKGSAGTVMLVIFFAALLFGAYTLAARRALARAP